MLMSHKGRVHLSWVHIIADERRRHPHMAVGDLHKLVIQACFGGDHLLRNPDAFRDGFASEWDGLPIDTPYEDALQPIHPSSGVARIHLGACKAMGLSRDALLKLLLSQPLKSGRQETCEWAWAMVLQSARFGEIPFSYDQLAQIRLADEMTHHSPGYGPAAYRMINDMGHGPTLERLCHLGILQ